MNKNKFQNKMRSIIEAEPNHRELSQLHLMKSNILDRLQRGVEVHSSTIAGVVKKTVDIQGKHDAYKYVISLSEYHELIVD